VNDDSTIVVVMVDVCVVLGLVISHNVNRPFAESNTALLRISAAAEEAIKYPSTVDRT
jgi:hypothetical protein